MTIAEIGSDEECATEQQVSPLKQFYSVHFIQKRIQECKENIEAFCSEAGTTRTKKLISRTPNVVKKIEQVKMV